MSSTLERRVVTLDGVRVGGGPAVVLTSRTSLRGPGDGKVPEGALVEPSSAADLPGIAERAAGVVVGAAWTRDFALVRAAAAIGLPVVVERRSGASVEEWLGVAEYCAAEGNDQIILCETGSLDLGVLQAAGEAAGRPVIANISENVGLAGAAVAAGADGLIVRRKDADRARDAVTLVGALLRPESPATLTECREAIDRVDAALATLLERRAAIAGIVQRLKPVGGFAGRDPERERAVVARMASRAPELGEERLAPIVNAVIEAGLLLAEQRSSATG